MKSEGIENRFFKKYVCLSKFDMNFLDLVIQLDAF